MEPIKIVDVADMAVEERIKIALLFLSHLDEMESELLVRLVDRSLETLRMRNGGQVDIQVHVG